MPDLISGQLAIPFGGRGASRHTSLQGARVAVVRASSQAARLLVRYLDHGPQTDGQQALALGLPEARISARRAGLIAKGLVAHCDVVPGPFGANVCRWELTVRGVHLAGSLRSAR
jgi:hypothetical protein